MKKILFLVFLLGMTAVSYSADLPKGDWVVALSNSYYGNTWRKQMVDVFTSAAKDAKKKGYIKDYIVVNGDGTQNQQISQMNSLILKGVDIILVNAASPTALNGVIGKAIQRGIKVLAFDSVVTHPKAYTMDFDFTDLTYQGVEFAAKQLGNKPVNAIVVRGVSGSAPDLLMYEGHQKGLSKHKNFKVVATVNGEASTTTTQNAIANVLPSLPKVDVVLTQGGGDAYGVVQAYLAARKEMPLILGDGTAEFIQWWIGEKRKNGYSTMSIASAPSIGSAAFWVGLEILNGKKVKRKMRMALTKVTNDTVDDYKKMKPGTITAPVYDLDFVRNNIIN